MYQDYTAILLMLLTAIPLAVVADTILVYIRNNGRKTPLKREVFLSLKMIFTVDINYYILFLSLSEFDKRSLRRINDK